MESSQINLTTTLKAIKKFERKIYLAIKSRYANEREEVREHLVENHPLLNQIDLQKFFDIYKSAEVYPLKRLPQTISYLMDIKIQMYFIELDTVLYNQLIHIPHQGIDYKKNPRLLLSHLSLDQSMVVKSRILWERIMNFVYYLETGERLENAVKKKQSKKSLFWNAVGKNFPKWNYLRDYEDFVNCFDNQLRTPEVHKSSTLRAKFMKNEAPNSDVLLTLQNISMNIWQNVFYIIQGEKPRNKFWTSGQNALQISKTD